MQKYFFVYAEIFFRICRNIFSYMQKYFSFRKQIFFRSDENISPSARGFPSGEISREQYGKGIYK
ncbi:hypothetical protein HQ43_04455 [Porphyromonas canoris]|uniref:Uncharacterized protein n=1 Tax=Porphyromonas canoris TaxID=36875 RepID=A0ABR4XME3_9PORP|nr:hypothetical protein HQ43_04455 [Porphyromonas canoris]